MRFSNLSGQKHSYNYHIFLFAGLFLILTAPVLFNYFKREYENAYVFFAQSLLDGNLHLPPMKNYINMTFFNSKYYLPYPPMPGILLVPFVALFGVKLNVVSVAILFSAINYILLIKLLTRLQVNNQLIFWFILAFFFASPYWYVYFATHTVFYFAHVCAIMFTLLFLNEYFGRKRYALMGFLIGCTFLCRQFTLFHAVIPFLAIALENNKSAREKITSISKFLIPLSIFVGIYLAYNYIRFGDPLDTGYDKLVWPEGPMEERIKKYGLFSYHYVLYNLYSFLFKGCNIIFGGNTLLELKSMDIWGTSIIAASPFVIFSLRRGLAKTEYRLFWLSIIIIMTGHLFYHNNGYFQINVMRFTLDFFPLLMVLIVTGLRTGETWMFKVFVSYSILLNLIAFTVHYFTRQNVF